MRIAIPSLLPPWRYFIVLGPLYFGREGSLDGRVPVWLTQLPFASSVVTTNLWSTHLKTSCALADSTAISCESAVESIRCAFGCLDAPRAICEAPPIGIAAPATKAASSGSMPAPSDERDHQGSSGVHPGDEKSGHESCWEPPGSAPIRANSSRCGAQKTRSTRSNSCQHGARFVCRACFAPSTPRADGGADGRRRRADRVSCQHQRQDQLLRGQRAEGAAGAPLPAATRLSAPPPLCTLHNTLFGSTGQSSSARMAQR